MGLTLQSVHFQTMFTGSSTYGPRYTDVCRKDMIVHIAEAEMHNLTSFKRLKGDYVTESYGIFAAIFTFDNANSSVRIKGLYDASHMTTSAVGLSLLYLLS